MLYLTTLLVYIVIDALCDKEMIDRRKNVHTIGQYALRALILTGYAILCNKGWIVVLNNILIYWFVFDTVLNVFRGKPLYYLSKKGIDGLQRRFMGVGPWFFFKFLLAAGSIAYLLNPSLFTYDSSIPF